MRTFRCVCGAMIFFENGRCLACSRELGWCPGCRDMTALEAVGSRFRCLKPDCRADLIKCHNYAVEDVCNRCILADSVNAPEGALCDCCRFNRVIPDLTVPGNRQKWYRLEQAKRRLIYGLNLAGLPYGNEADGFEPPLGFDFKEDLVRPGDHWHAMGTAERVFTGHANGLITINIREADDVEREAARVNFGEKQRTLIGHFRHEFGHYYWCVLVLGKQELAFKQVFGDHEHPPYAEALARYYQYGAPADWSERYISAYASAHPWEDFAETFAAYLDLVSVLDTAASFGFGGPRVTPDEDVERLVRYYQNVGIFMNEMNRAMGLIDYVPKVLNPAVVEKMRFIHALVGEASVKAKPSSGSGRFPNHRTPGEDPSPKRSEWHDVHPDADTVASAAEDDPFDRADVAVVATPGERDV